MQTILNTTPKIGNGNNTAVIIEELLESFENGLISFQEDFAAKANDDKAWLKRVENFLAKRLLP